MDEMEEIFRGIDKATENIKLLHGKSNARGTIECPICKGKLHYTVASLNGHVHGKCETENCLSWME